MQVRDFLRLRSTARGFLYAASAMLAMVAWASPGWAGQSLWVANNASINIEQFQHRQLVSTGLPRPNLIGLLQNPLGISFDRKGNLWTTTGNIQVQEITAKQLVKFGKKSNPTPAVTITSSSFRNLVGSNFDHAGNLWIADASGAIYELSAAQLQAGSADLTPAITLTASGDFESPQFVAFDKAGDLWVSDEAASAVFEFTPDQLVGGNQVPRAITDGLAAPGELAFDHKKNLWVTNFDNSTVVEYSKTDLATITNPAPAIAITSPNNILNGAWGLAFDVSGDMWVANYTTGSIMKFGPVQLINKNSQRPKIFLGGANNFSYQITFGPAS
jgi:streptogramin lyase